MFPTEYRRKKSVPGHYNPNSFRVLNGEDLVPIQASHDAATQSSATNLNKSSEFKQQQTSDTHLITMNNNVKNAVTFKNEEPRFEATSLPLGDEIGRKQVRNHPHTQNTTMIADNMRLNSDIERFARKPKNVVCDTDLTLKNYETRAYRRMMDFINNNKYCRDVTNSCYDVTSDVKGAKKTKEEDRYLGEPILAMESRKRSSSGKADEHWWPNTSASTCTHEQVRRNATYDTNTTQRSSFNTAKNGTQLVMEAPSFYQQARGRHGSNPHVKPTEGILPTSDMKEEMRVSWKEQGSRMREHISFDHGYDARGLEPIRGRRHGSLVCDPILKKQASGNDQHPSKQNELTYRTMLKQHKH